MSLSDFHPSFFTIEEIGDVVVVRFRVDRLTDEDNIEQLGHELFALVDQYQRSKILLDLAGINLVSSSVLGKLITLHRRLHRGEGKLVIGNPGEYMTEILKTSRLHDYFHVAANRVIALQMLG